MIARPFGPCSAPESRDQWLDRCPGKLGRSSETSADSAPISFEAVQASRDLVQPALDGFELSSLGALLGAALLTIPAIAIAIEQSDAASRGTPEPKAIQEVLEAGPAPRTLALIAPP